MLTLRLDKELDRTLAQAAALAGLSKSAFVRKCLSEYLAEAGSNNIAWELGREVFGRRGSGRRDLSRRAKTVVREKIHARRRRG
jgi:hypothetical protein